MANNTVPEVSINPDKLQSPLRPGIDHADSEGPIRENIATSAGVPVETVIPESGKAELAQSTVDNYLEKMGAIKPETSFKQEAPPSSIEEFTKNAVALSPFGETDREGSSKIADEIEERRRTQLGYSEEKKAA